MNMNPNSLNNLNKNYSKWNNPETVAVRVPKVLKDEILAYARELDNGNRNQADISLSTKHKLLTLLAKIENKEKGYKSNGSGQLIKDLKELINEV